MDTTPESTPEQPQESATGADMSPVLDRVGQLADGFSSFTERFDQFLASQQPAQEPEADPWAAFDPYEPEGPEEPEQPQQQPLDVNALREAIQQEIQGAVSPYAQQLQSMRTQQELRDLYEKYPAIQSDPEVRQAVAREAQQIAEQMGVDPGALLNSGAYLGVIYEAIEGRKAAAQQQPAGALAELEAAGGASPGGTDPNSNIAQEIVAARTTLPGWAY